MNSGFCIISGICSKHNSYSSSETKSFLCRSVCLIRSFQNRISVSAESTEENSGNFSIMDSTMSCLICPIDTYLISFWNKSVLNLETFFIAVHPYQFVIYIFITLKRDNCLRPWVSILLSRFAPAWPGRFFNTYNSYIYYLDYYCGDISMVKGWKSNS